MPTAPTAGSAAPSADAALRPRLTPRDHLLLDAWLSTGPYDAEVVPDRLDAGSGRDQVLVWLARDAAPAYVIRPEAARWAIVDHLRQRTLGSLESFEAALLSIGPA